MLKLSTFHLKMSPVNMMAELDFGLSRGDVILPLKTKKMFQGVQSECSKVLRSHNEEHQASTSETEEKISHLFESMLDKSFPSGLDEYLKLNMISSHLLKALQVVAMTRRAPPPC